MHHSQLGDDQESNPAHFELAHKWVNFKSSKILKMRIHSPEGETSQPSIGLASPPWSLAGAKIGILDNTKPNAVLFMKRAAEGLVSKYGAKLVTIEKKNAALAAPEDLIERLSKEVQIVLTGSAD